MPKQLGRFLALVTMMASVINAQCTVSCSVHTVARSPAPQASPVESSRTGHSCCKHREGPEQKQQKDDAPCPHPAMTADEARLENNGGSFNFMPAMVVAIFGDQYCPPVAPIYPGSLTVPDSSCLKHPSSILRI